VPELDVAIGGMHVRFESERRQLLDVARDRYKGFLDTGRPDWTLALDLGSIAAAPDADVVVRTDDGRRITIQRGDFRATLDLSARRGRLVLAEADEFSLDSFLRVFGSLALAERNGLLVHASSVVRTGRAFLFPGVSGSGKSTVARLSADALVLSDEISIVRALARDARCHGSPFWGELARAGADHDAPLAGVYFLSQADHHELHPLTPRQAVSALLPNVLWFSRDTVLTAQVLDLAGTLVETVPCFALRFRRDAGFWRLIDDA
jgi:hypothetical protein